MSGLIENLNALIPIGGALIGIVGWAYSRFAAQNEKIHALELRVSEKYATKDDIADLKHDLTANFNRVHERLDALKSVK